MKLLFWCNTNQVQHVSNILSWYLTNRVRVCTVASYLSFGRRCLFHAWIAQYINKQKKQFHTNVPKLLPYRPDTHSHTHTHTHTHTQTQVHIYCKYEKTELKRKCIQVKHTNTRLMHQNIPYMFFSHTHISHTHTHTHSWFWRSPILSGSTKGRA